MSNKLGVIVPYRNRYPQLVQFKEKFHSYMEGTGIDYTLIIVEQDDATAFNRGKLLNIGFKKAEELKCNYVVFHDVDMIPESVDYSFSEYPVHLATGFKVGEKETGIHFDRYFGGVTLFPNSEFKYINGYSNEYWGWGFEDDDLFQRCLLKELPVDSKVISTTAHATTALKFNGKDAFVKVDNKINFSEDFSIYVSFEAENSSLDHTKEVDQFTIFCIPGYDLKLSYNSFNRYTLQVHDKRGTMHTLDSPIVQLYPTSATIVWDSTNNTLKYYLDSDLIGELKLYKGIWNYSNASEIYIGSNKPEIGEYFEGYVESFALFSTALPEKEIASIASNTNFSLLHDFENYSSSFLLTSYYDCRLIRGYKLIDLTLKKNTGLINNCEIVAYNRPRQYFLPIPFRRQSVFSLTDHESSGYVGGRWASQLTRYNQLKFSNELRYDPCISMENGLSNLTYTLHSEVKVDNNIHLVVGL